MIRSTFHRPFGNAMKQAASTISLFERDLDAAGRDRHRELQPLAIFGQRIHDNTTTISDREAPKPRGNDSQTTANAEVRAREVFQFLQIVDRAGELLFRRTDLHDLGALQREIMGIAVVQGQNACAPALADD